MLAKENMDDMKVADLVEAMKATDEEQNGLRYRITEVVSFSVGTLKLPRNSWS